MAGVSEAEKRESWGEQEISRETRREMPGSEEDEELPGEKPMSWSGEFGMETGGERGQTDSEGLRNLSQVLMRRDRARLGMGEGFDIQPQVYVRSICPSVRGKENDPFW